MHGVRVWQTREDLEGDSVNGLFSVVRSVMVGANLMGKVEEGFISSKGNGGVMNLVPPVMYSCWAVGGGRWVGRLYPSRGDINSGRELSGGDCLGRWGHHSVALRDVFSRSS